MPSAAIITHPIEFTEGTRIVSRVCRNKDNAVKRPALEIVTNDSQEFYAALATCQEDMRLGERIYSHIDARNPVKAVRHFRQKQLDAEYSDDPLLFYFTLERRWKSSLCQPECRVTKYFLFDIDSPYERAYYDQLKTLPWFPEVHHTYLTKNGFHAITSPFNRDLLPADFLPCVKTNAQMLWAYV